MLPLASFLLSQSASSCLKREVPSRWIILTNTTNSSPKPLILGNVLVTGGCGFLGSHIVRRLLEDPDCASVAVVSRNPTTNRNVNASYHAADITDEKNIRLLLETVRPDVIIHTVSPDHEADPHVLHETNVPGTEVLLRCADRSPHVKAFIYTSSEQAIIPSETQQTEETAKLYDDKARATPYSKSKALAEALVLNANISSFRTATIRTPGLYGEGDTKKIPILLDTLRQGNHRMQIGTNKKLFEFLYVESAASAHVLAAKALLASYGKPAGAPRVDGEAFLSPTAWPYPSLTLRARYGLWRAMIRQRRRSRRYHSGSCSPWRR